MVVALVRLDSREGLILLGVSIVTMLITRNFLILIGALIATALVMSYIQTEQILEEQRQRESERKLEEWKSQQEEQEQQRLVEMERMNQEFYIPKFGTKRLPDGTFEVASPEEQAAVGRVPRK